MITDPPDQVLAKDLYQGSLSSRTHILAGGTVQHQQIDRYSTWRRILAAAFLPEGYPASTSPDYLGTAPEGSVERDSPTEILAALLASCLLDLK